MEVKLRDCPFCGGKPSLFVSKGSRHDYDTGRWYKFPKHASIRCQRCNCGTGRCDDEARAIAIWERRQNVGAREAA